MASPRTAGRFSLDSVVDGRSPGKEAKVSVDHRLGRRSSSAPKKAAADLRISLARRSSAFSRSSSFSRTRSSVVSSGLSLDPPFGMTPRPPGPG